MVGSLSRQKMRRMTPNEQTSPEPTPGTVRRIDPAAGHVLVLEMTVGALLLGIATLSADWWLRPLFGGYLFQSIFRHFEAYPFNILYKSERPRWSFMLMLPARWVEWLARNPYRRALTWAAFIALDWQFYDKHAALIYAVGIALSRVIQNIIARSTKELLMGLLKRR